jgi:hypothetical protein
MTYHWVVPHVLSGLHGDAAYFTVCVGHGEGDSAVYLLHGYEINLVGDVGAVVGDVCYVADEHHGCEGGGGAEQGVAGGGFGD